MRGHRIEGRDPRTGECLSVLVEQGTISGIEASSNQNGLYLSPGLIDLQVNGYSGFDVNDDLLTEATIVSLVEAQLSVGVTCFAPTIISAPEEKICRALRVIASARNRDPRAAACIPFVHVEGPHISPLDGYRGAHDRDSVRPPSFDEFKRWQDVSDGLVGLITMSPHYEESSSYIGAVRERGVHVAIGHTHATPEQIVRAVDAGARLSTHLGNGIALEIPRHHNPLWAQLSNDRLTASFIADGHHLPPDVLKTMLRAKGLQRSVLVSDTVALAGMSPGAYTTPVGGRVDLREDGRLCLSGTELLAGATASLAQCVGNVVRSFGIPLHQALEMVTATPGQYVGGRGQLACGARADLVRFRWHDDIIIEDVWLAGEQVYLATGEKRNRL